MSVLTFDCGCTIPVINDVPQIDYYNLNLECPKTWSTYQTGYTQSIFQLESYLGKMWSKKLKPASIADASALISIIRPGVLEAQDENGTNLAQLFCDRKNNNWKPNPDSIIENMLEETMGIWCIHEDTYISMSNGTEKQIKNIIKNDKLLSVSNNTIENDTCYGIIKSPKSRGYKLTLENGFNIILTPDHKVLTNNGMKELQNLDINKDVVAIGANQYICDIDKSENINNNYSWLSPNLENIYYLCGQLLGDGCGGRIIATGTKENHDKLFDWLNKNFSKSLNIKEFFNVRSWYISLSGKELANELNYGNRKTKYTIFLENFTLNNTKHNKIISDEIMTAPRNLRRAFLAGLFDSDGHSSKNGCHITSTNPYVINCVRKLFAIENIEINVSDNRIHINNSEKLHSILSKFLVIKSIYINTYGLSYGSYPKEKIKEHIVKTGESIKPFCVKNKISSASIFKKANFCNISTAKKAGIKFGDIDFMQIKSITKIDSDLVFYSIAVTKNHNLIGNGIIISNCYQEQVMTVSQKLANFEGPKQIKLIKAIGKKDNEALMSLKQNFIDGCADKIPKSEAEKIFDNIEKSGRYLFNKSHAVSYAVTGYWTAWVKSHLPTHYICSWLRNAKNEQKPLEEIRAVISEARRLGIRVLPPSIKNLPHTNFFIKKDTVHFGLDSIKGCGEKGLAKLLNLNIDFESISWLDFLVQYSDKITKTQVVNMIRSGCFDCYFISRTEAEFQYNLWISVCNTPAAKAAAASLYDQHKPKTIRELFSLYHDACNLKKKKDSILDVIKNIDNPSYLLEDSKSLIIEHEKALLGINVTCSAVSKSSIPTVKDYCNTIDKLRNNTPVVIVGEISEYRDIKIKNGTMTGQIMGSFQLTDESGHCDCVIFPKELSLYEGALYDGNVILAHGKKGNRGGIIIEKIFEI